MKDNKRVTLIKLFETSFLISLFTLGAGIVSFPLYKRKVVDEYKWLSEEEMSDAMTIAQCSPGAFVVNIAVCLGYQLHGIAGIFAMVIGTMMPPLLLMILVQDVYQQFSGDSLVIAMFRGMNAAVAAVLINVVIGMIKDIKENKLVTYLLLVIAFGMVYFFKVSPVWVISGGIVLALLVSRPGQRR